MQESTSSSSRSNEKQEVVLYVSQTHHHDVLCSSSAEGGKSHNNETCQEKNRPGEKDAKAEMLAEKIVHEILSLDLPGRFLKRDVPSGRWFDNGFQKAACGTKHALDDILKPKEPKKEQQQQQINSRDALPSSIIPQESHAVTEYNDHDVLCGARVRKNHPGNVYFRQLVDRNYETYWKDCIHVRRRAIATEIVREIMNTNPPGRFLKQDLQSKTKWYDIGLDQAIKRTSQIFLDKQMNKHKKKRNLQKKWEQLQVSITSEEIHHHDVLCTIHAPDKMYHECHPGNSHYRSLVETFRVNYSSVQKRKVIAVKIMDEITSLDPPGRFLRRAGERVNGRVPWYVIGPDGLKTIELTITNHLQERPRERKLSPTIMQQCPDIHTHDIICTIGPGVTVHPGNAHFRELVKRNVTKYQNSKKDSTARAIVHELTTNKDPPGRFMKRNTDSTWYDIGFNMALIRTKKALCKRKNEIEANKVQPKKFENVHHNLDVEDKTTQPPAVKKRSLNPQISTPCPGTSRLDISRSLATEAVSYDDDDDGDTNFMSFEVEGHMANISETSSSPSSPLHPPVKPRNERNVIETSSCDAEESVFISDSDSDSSSIDITFHDQLDYDKSVDFLSVYSNAV